MASFSRRSGLLRGGFDVRSFALASPGLPGAPAMIGAAKKAVSATPIVPVTRKTFPESWLWETLLRLVHQVMG